MRAVSFQDTDHNKVIRMNNKVLILSNRDTGLFFFRREVIESIINEGFKLYISVPLGDYTDALRDMGSIIIPTEVDRRGKNPINDIKLINSYIRLIRKIRPLVVLTYTIKPNIYGGFACSALSAAQVANITGLGTEIEKGGVASKALLTLYRVSLSNARRVFVQNATIDQLLGKYGIANDKRQVIPGSGVNLEAHPYIEYPTDESTIRFLYIGRIMKDKGSSELLHAAKEIKREHPNVVFDIVGRCDEEGYDELVHDYNEKGIIAFHGFQTDVNPYLGRAHALIQPSYHEGLSNVLLEAAATGRPVLSSRVPGCQETFEEGVSGMGFEAKSVDSLVNAIESFLKLSNEQKREMGCNGRKKIEKEFSRKNVVNAYLKQINEIEHEAKKK